MARDYKLISADSHINEPPDLWRDRVPAKFRDRAPRIEHFEQGDAWVMEGALDAINFGANCYAGLPAEQRSPWIPWEDVRAGGYDPAARIAEQDEDGVDAEILYPTPRVGNQVFWHVQRPRVPPRLRPRLQRLALRVLLVRARPAVGCRAHAQHRHRHRDRRAPPRARRCPGCGGSCSASTRTVAS